MSTIGANATQFNLLNRSQIFEVMLRDVAIPVALLRAGWFMENAAWDVAAAREGQIHSYLQPLDRTIEMVSVRDIGSVAADLLREDWVGVRTIELSGPRKYSPNDEAAGFAAALGRPVKVLAVPRDCWEERFRSEGMGHPEARIGMLDGFNEGWIDFGRPGVERRSGSVPFEDVLRDLIAPQN